MTEAQIQKAVFAQLRQRAMPGVVAWAVPNNPQGRRTPGFLAGVSDVHILHRGKFYAMELKKHGGRPSEEQLEYISRVNAADGFAFLAEGLDEAICGMEAWGLLRGAAWA